MCRLPYRFLTLFACVLVVSACNNGVASLYQGPGIPIEMLPIASVCPEADDADALSLLPPSLSAYPTEPAGTINGAFSVSTTGEAIYSLDLSLPPGRAGMAPPISLVYESS